MDYLRDNIAYILVLVIIVVVAYDEKVSNKAFHHTNIIATVFNVVVLVSKESG